MVADGLKKKDVEAIAFLRAQAKELMNENYDTDFNILRWAQGYNYNLDEASKNLLWHLKIRRFYDLDNIHKQKDEKMLKQYLPLGLVGETGKGDHFLVIECAGRIDLQGILRTVQLSKFLEQRLKFQEMVLREINAMEARTGAQSSAIYILDVEGLKLDPKLVSVVTGPYQLLWNFVYANYPEWIDHLFVVNAPTFIAFLWRAIAPYLPERTCQKVRIFSSNDSYLHELEKYCNLNCVPKHWGGTMVDKFGDPMCRDRLIIPIEGIPESLYWKPDELSPAHNVLNMLNLAPGHYKTITLRLYPFKNDKVHLAINRYAERSYSMAIYYNENTHSGVNDDEGMIEWAPEIIYPAMPTVDLLKQKALGPGIYKVKFGNTQAWFRSVTIRYRIQFVDDEHLPVSFDEIEE